MLSYRIRKIRETCFKSQLDMSEFFGVSQKTVSNWEVGRNEPPSSFFSKMSTDFNISLEWLLTGKGDMFNIDKMKEVINKAFPDGKIVNKEAFEKVAGKMADDTFDELIRTKEGTSQKVYNLDDEQDITDDLEILELIVERVETTLNKADKELEPRLKARLIKNLFAYCKSLSLKDTEEKVIETLKMVV